MYVLLTSCRVPCLCPLWTCAGQKWEERGSNAAKLTNNSASGGKEVKGRKERLSNNAKRSRARGLNNLWLVPPFINCRSDNHISRITPRQMNAPQHADIQTIISHYHFCCAIGFLTVASSAQHISSAYRNACPSRLGWRQGVSAALLSHPNLKGSLCKHPGKVTTHHTQGQGAHA